MESQDPNQQKQPTTPTTPATTKKDSSLKKKTKTFLDYLHLALRKLDLQR